MEASLLRKYHSSKAPIDIFRGIVFRSKSREVGPSMCCLLFFKSLTEHLEKDGENNSKKSVK